MSTNPEQKTKAKTRPGNIPMISSVPQDVGSVPSAIIGVPRETKENMDKWLADIYNSAISMTDEDIQLMYDAFRYKGFNRDEVLKQLMRVAPDPRLANQIIVLCALRGPQAASRTQLLTGQTPIQMGIPASGGQGKLILTCNKITAATADLAAYLLKRMNVPKRLDMDCPAWLQFPSAGGIRLPMELRRQHKEFHHRFSGVIGGVFQEQIYLQMEHNSYLDERLDLFHV